MSATTKPVSRVKQVGNITGWLISVLSGAFTLYEVLLPKGVNLSDLGLSNDLDYLFSIFNIWYVRYGIVVVFVLLLLFFVFPREEERVKKRRKNSRAKKKN